MQAVPQARGYTRTLVSLAGLILVGLLNLLLMSRTGSPASHRYLASSRIADPVSQEVVPTSPAALLAGYDPQRAFRACAPLPDNITISLEGNFVPGFASELQISDQRLRELRAQYPPFSGSVESVGASSSRWAYVLMVSNHKYVDGALVMGDSLWEHSALVRNGTCDVIIVVTDTLHEDSLHQLALVFRRVKIARTLGRFAKKSAYAATFDKLYLFLLVEYERVMFLDADHLVYEGDKLDKAWTKKTLAHPNDIVAVGDRDYFQTALMIVQPDPHIFTDLYLEFRLGTFGYNQWRARDGILLRNCFRESVKGISHVGGLFHFYGFTKPWFNKDKSPKRRSEHYMLRYDVHYRDWWARYRRLHLTALSRLTISTEYGSKAWISPLARRWLQAKRPDQRPHPSEFMWLQRHSGGSEYLRPLPEVDADMRSLSLPGFQIIDALESRSCLEACTAHNLHCRDEALMFTSVSNVSALLARSNSGPSAVSHAVAECEVTDSVSWAPAFVPGTRCVVSALDDPLERPVCNGTAPRPLRRVCPCVPRSSVTADPIPQWHLSA